jgi:hypothetical protein
MLITRSMVKSSLGFLFSVFFGALVVFWSATALFCSRSVVSDPASLVRVKAREGVPSVGVGGVSAVKGERVLLSLNLARFAVIEGAAANGAGAASSVASEGVFRLPPGAPKLPSSPSGASTLRYGILDEVLSKAVRPSEKEN